VRYKATCTREVSLQLTVMDLTPFDLFLLRQTDRWEGGEL